MFRWEGDENVGDTSLAVSLGVKIPCRRGGRGRDERTKESIRFGIGDDTTVIDDRYCGVLDGCVPSAPRIKRKMCTHEHLSVRI